MEPLLEALFLKTSRLVLQELLSSLNNKDLSSNTCNRNPIHANTNVSLPPGVPAQAYSVCLPNSPLTSTSNPVPELTGQYIQSPTLEVSATPAEIIPVTKLQPEKQQREGSNTAVDLYSWCPVMMLEDGDCRVAGIASKTPTSFDFQFTITEVVLSVYDDGKCIKTKDECEYRLHGGICWSTYCVLNPQTIAEYLPSDILTAFCSGFPKQNWRSWIQGIYYFACNIQDDASTVGYSKQNNGHQDKQPNHFVKRSGLMLGKQILSRHRSSANHSVSNLCNVDLDDEDDSSSDPSDSVNQSTVQSHFSSVSNSAKKRRKRVQRLSLRRRTHSNRNKKSNVSTESGNSSLSSSSSSTESTILSVNKHNRIASKHQINDIDEKFRLYTQSGTVLDARRLEKTRSGRWVVPKLDSRHEQSIIVDRGRVTGVNRGFKN